ncbi:MAG TPA: hypothetical protein VIV40_22740 [Kofleriaceae bacterium]
MHPIVCGGFLGIFNIVIIAFGITVREHAGFAGFCAMSILGSFPAVGAGVAIGAIANRTPHWPVLSRLTVIIAPALFVVVAFGTLARFDAYVALAFMPTIAAALYLERSTRARAMLPAAQTAYGHCVRE